MPRSYVRSVGADGAGSERDCLHSLILLLAEPVAILWTLLHQRGLKGREGTLLSCGSVKSWLDGWWCKNSVKATCEGISFLHLWLQILLTKIANMLGLRVSLTNIFFVLFLGNIFEAVQSSNFVGLWHHEWHEVQNIIDFLWISIREGTVPVLLHNHVLGLIIHFVFLLRLRLNFHLVQICRVAELHRSGWIWKVLLCAWGSILLLCDGRCPNLVTWNLRWLYTRLRLFKNLLSGPSDPNLHQFFFLLATIRNIGCRMIYYIGCCLRVFWFRIHVAGLTG